jgi:hypothetical protein
MGTGLKRRQIRQALGLPRPEGIGRRTVMMGWYILNQKDEPVPCDDMAKHSEFMENSGKKFVAKTTVGTYVVSTVFLGLDHNFYDEGPPILWETMVFDSNFNEQYCKRYSSLVEALAGHEETVKYTQLKSAVE